jgi:hypothetical protein
MVLMDTMHVYLMHSPEKALDAIKTIDQKSTDLVIGLGLVLLVDDDGGWQWYAFANLRAPKPAEDERVLSALKKGGVRSDFSTKQLLTHPWLGASVSGTHDQMVKGLWMAFYKWEDFKGRKRMLAMLENRGGRPN